MAAYQATFTGATWQHGLPPGLYEDRQQALVPADIRMDVTVFIGLCERGPIATPVILESWEDFKFFFGSPGGGRILPQSVYMFFASGGRRCVVVRVIDYQNARTGITWIPGLKSISTGAEPVLIAARNPGSWSNRLSINCEFIHENFNQILAYSNSRDAGNVAELQGDPPLSGSLMRFTYGDVEQMDEYTFIEDVTVLDNGRYRMTLTRPLEALFNAAASPPGHGCYAQLVTLDLTIELTQPGETEIWRGLGLHSAHPNYIFRLLGRRCASEQYMQHNPFDDDPMMAGAPDMPFAGSQLVRPLYEEHQSTLLPAMDLRTRKTLDSAHALSEYKSIRIPEVVLKARQKIYSEQEPDQSLIGLHIDQFNELFDSSEAELSLIRNHFFQPPQTPPELSQQQLRNYVFAGQEAPLACVDRYDDDNETQPVSLIHLPDLVHFPRPSAEIIDEEPLRPFEFERCSYTEPQREDIRPILHYQYLEDLNEAGDAENGFQGPVRMGPLDALKELKRWCEQKDDRIGIAELLPQLTSSEIRSWRRQLASSRISLYTPYLNVPAVHNEQQMISVPSGGAVCGIIAVRERVSGVSAAPANETIVDVISLHEPQWQPDPGFLFEQRINGIRETENGFDVLGSRTLSLEPAWTHISVRRLIDYLKRQLVIDTQWAVFEPNDRILWSALIDAVEARLKPLYEAGAFVGTSPDQAYFVRCDSGLNTQYLIDNGQVIILVGVAPSVPAEFLVFEILHQIESAATGTTNV